MKKKPLKMQRKKTSILLAACLVTAVIVFVTGGVAHAEPEGCFPLFGKFKAEPLPPDLCDSPVGFCTTGRLTGALKGSYEFTMETMLPTDPNLPTILFYTGQSVIETKLGSVVTGIDTGTIDLNPDMFGNFTALITITDGTSYLENTYGQLVLRGKVDFETGGSRGRYTGSICFVD